MVPELSAVVVSWNTREILSECLSSLRAHLNVVSHEVIVVDNASSDGSPDMVEQAFPDARLVRNAENEGFGRGNNAGMGAARGRFILLLNSDAYLVDDTVVRLLDRLRASPEIGVAAPRLVSKNGQLQASARRFPSIPRLAVSELGLYRLLPRDQAAQWLLGSHWDHATEMEVDWLVGACLLLRRQVFEETGGFDPTMFLYGEEVEWCWRIRKAGWHIVYSPIGTVVHLNHRSADLLLGTTGRIDRCLAAEDRLLRRWSGRWGAAAPTLRVVGAFLRLFAFGARLPFQPAPSYAHDMVWDARATLSHYWRRARGWPYGIRS